VRLGATAHTEFYDRHQLQFLLYAADKMIEV
jgi:hypothetical protein